MEARLGPVRRQAFAVLALALIAAGPWVGFEFLIVLFAALVVFALADRRMHRSRRPERWAAFAWAVAPLVIAGSAALTGGPESPALMWLGLPVVTLGARFEPRGVRLGRGVHDRAAAAGDGRARRRLRLRAPPGADLPVRAHHRDGDPGRRRAAVGARAPARGGHRPADRAAQSLRLRAAAGRAPAPDRPGRRVLARLPDGRHRPLQARSTTSTATRSATPCCATWRTPCAASCAPSTSSTGWAARSSRSCCRAPTWRRRARSPSACGPRSPRSDTGGVSVTMSFGAGAVSGSDVRLARLYAQADAALYEAKRAGRNRVGSAALAA